MKHVKARSPESDSRTGVMRTYTLPVVAPYRLDLTVSALRRLSTNVVDLFTPEGVYMRALAGIDEPVVVRVTQVAKAHALSVAIEGDAHDDDAVLGVIARMLGADIDLRRFYRRAAPVAWLAPLVKRMRGVKPPRYPSLWEACVNAIVFQQISLRAASAVMHRLTMSVGRSLQANDVPIPLYLFPDPERVQRATDHRLHTAGLSANKIGTLRRVAEALSSGALDETALERCTSPNAAAMLRRIKGIGPWTAAIILLRGLGRLDVFPANDSSVANNIAFVAGPEPLDVPRVVNDLGPQRGMLYFHLLLARLDARAELGRASFEPRPLDTRADTGARDPHG
jgi:DNA-3-methyladenine glycosylase II